MEDNAEAVTRSKLDYDLYSLITKKGSITYSVATKRLFVNARTQTLFETTLEDESLINRIMNIVNSINQKIEDDLSQRLEDVLNCDEVIV